VKFRRGSDKAGFVLLLLVMLGIGALALGWWRHIGFAAVPMAGIRQGDTLLVQRGDSLSRVVERLRAQGVRTGNLLFLAGQGAQNREGQVPEPADFEAQVRRTFANMQAVLEAAGGTLANIVTMTTFLVDMRRAPEFARLRREILGSDFPADALIGVSQLWDPALMLEIQAIAVLD